MKKNYTLKPINLDQYGIILKKKFLFKNFNAKPTVTTSKFNSHFN